MGLFVLLVSIFGLSGSGHTASPDEEGMLAQTRALAHGRPSIVIDESNTDVASRRELADGTIVGVSGLGQSVTGLPMFAAGKAVARLVGNEDQRSAVVTIFTLFTNAMVTAATACVLLQLSLLLGAPLKRGVALALTFALGTFAWHEARTFFSEPLTALLVLTGVTAAIAAPRSERVSRWTAAAGLAVGLAVNVRSTALLFPPLIGFYLLATLWRRWGIRSAAMGLATFAATFLSMVGLYLASNWWRFGSPLDLGPTSVPFTYPWNQGLWNLYFSPGKSLFLYTPVVLIATIGLPLSRCGGRQRKWRC